ncbi:MAG: ATPase domain-containing protein, partial [Planctomycetota bacterium]
MPSTLPAAASIGWSVTVACSWNQRCASQAAPLPLTSAPDQDSERVVIGINEIDRVLGGGIVPGSVVLIGGDPGIGKSTLLLQILSALAVQGHTVLYVSGEESAHQIKLRARRLSALHDNHLLATENSVEQISAMTRDLRPS